MSVAHWAIVLLFLAVMLRPWRWTLPRNPINPLPAAIVRVPDRHPSLSDHVKRHGARIGAAGFFWSLAAWRSLREGSLSPLVHHAEWRATWKLARSIAIVLALIPIAAHADGSIVQFHGGVSTPAQEFQSQGWRDAIRADQERAWKDALAYCRENPGMCVYHNVPKKDR